MSANSKTRRALKRKQEKRARKASQKAVYESYRDSGRNKKSKRFRNNQAKPTVSSVKHADSFCGNLGCERCYPQYKRQRKNEPAKKVK